MDFTRFISMAFVAIALLTGVPTATWAASAVGSCADGTPNSFDAVSTGDPVAPRFPSFCSIPATPRDVRTADAYKAAVLNSRRAGAALARDTSASEFSLKDTSVFQADAKRAAEAPPAITEPGELDADAFIKAARMRASPPPRPR